MRLACLHARKHVSIFAKLMHTFEACCGQNCAASSLTLTHHTAEPHVNSCATHLHKRYPFSSLIFHSLLAIPCSRQIKPEINQFDRASPGDVAKLKAPQPWPVPVNSDLLRMLMYLHSLSTLSDKSGSLTTGLTSEVRGGLSP